MIYILTRDEYSSYRIDDVLERASHPDAKTIAKINARREKWSAAQHTTWSQVLIEEFGFTRVKYEENHEDDEWKKKTK